MLYIKDYTTCDRCGKLIEQTPKQCRNRFIQYHLFGDRASKIISNNVDRSGYIAESDLIVPGVPSIRIVESYDSKTKEYDLCGKCRKDFEKFIKMDDLDLGANL